MTIECKDLHPLLPAYLDGELTGSEMEDVESHSATCASCAQMLREESQFLARIRKDLAPPPAPDLFRKRLAEKLDGVDREYASAIRRQRLAWLLPGGAACVAAAALTVFVFSKTQTGGFESVSVTQEVVRQRFEQPIPVVRTGSRPELSRVAQDLVHVPVRPPRFAVPGVDLRGFHQSQVLGRDAAVFVYDVLQAGKHHAVYMYIFDARGLEVRTPEPRVIDGRELWVSQIRGMGTVSYKDEQQTGYVFISDMSSNELADLVERSDLLLLLNPPGASESTDVANSR